MGILEIFLGGGLEQKVKRLDRMIETGGYNDAEEFLLDLRVTVSRKHPPGSELSIRLDLAEVKLRSKYQQFDRLESPARRAFVAAKCLNDKELLRQAAEAMIDCAVRGGRLNETVEMTEQWIAIGSSDFKQRVDILITKGSALNQLGRFNDALRAYEASIRLVDSMPETPDKHERFVTASSGMGDAYLGLDDRAQAINSWRQAMGATNAQYGPEHPQIASILVCIGTVQLNADEIEPACGSFTQALEVFRAAGHSEAMGAAVALQKLTLAYLMKGDVPRASTTAKSAQQASAAHGPEMTNAAHELMRKVQDAQATPPSGLARLKLLKSAEELQDDIPMMDRTMFPARAATARPLNRPGRGIPNAKWAAMGR